MKPRKITFFTTVAILLSFQVIYPQSEIKNNVLKGLNYYYNFNWTQAESIFQKIIDKYPDDPRGYYYGSSIYFWYYFSNKDKDDLKKFFEYSEMAIDKAVALIDSLNDDPALLYILGANYSYRAMTFAQVGKFLDAVWATKKSETFLNKVISIDPNYYDAYLGLGLYNFAMGQIPKAFQWALSLAGMKGDKEKGLTYIKTAVDHGTFSKVEAKFYYSQILSDFFADNNTAISYMNSLIAKYPNNLLFKYSLAIFYTKERKLDHADRILKKIVSTSSKKFNQLIAYSNFLIGDNFFKKNDFDSAIVYYNRFILSTNDNDYTGIANFRLGVCYKFLNQDDVAQTYFKMADRGNLGIDDDIYAKRRGSLFSSAKFTDDDLKMVLFKHYVEAGKYNSAIDSLSELVARTKSNDVKAEALLYLSDALYSIGQYKASIDTAKSIIDIDVANEDWVKPYACYFSARSEQILGNKEETMKYLEKADDYSNYDYQNKLKNLLFAMKSQEKK